MNSLRRWYSRWLDLHRDWEDPALVLAARHYVQTNCFAAPPDEHFPASKEFRCYSQFGDDGIIQYLVQRLDICCTSFIEFGVGDYFESNTHLLLIKDGWQGFVMDSSPENIERLRNSSICWRYGLEAAQAFVTAENITSLLDRSGFDEVGLLHIDIDGNDFWVLRNIDLKRYRPDILILEYNSYFGADRAISIPYNPKFIRTRSHTSGLYYGASLKAFADELTPRGYYLVGCNSAGNNAYFLADRHRDSVPRKTVAAAYRRAKFREARDERGRLLHAGPVHQVQLLTGLPVINVSSGRDESL